MNQSPKFPLGQLVTTPGVMETVNPEDALECLARHAAGDWDELPAEDRRENEIALEVGGLRIWSTYRDRNQVRFWIITEADRSATTLTLPSEY
ncbi:MAG: hypothetical protein JWO82_2552 [Akkermansiaceae bacterium]|nr:hypothetical protein [Akkermansiaceae bacterium]